MTASAWTVLERSANGKGSTWQHVTGWTLAHCGHPTSNWPYYLSRGDLRCVVSEGNRGFRTVAAAKRAVEALVAGQARVEPMGDHHIAIGVDSNGEATA